MSPDVDRYLEFVASTLQIDDLNGAGPNALPCPWGHVREHWAGIADLDAATIRLTTPRALTQEMSRLIFDDTTAGGTRRWNGIKYLSKFGDDLENWAIFEPTTPSTTDISAIDEHDEDLIAALQLHGLRMSTNAAERN